MRNTLKIILIIIFSLSLIAPFSAFGSDISVQLKTGLDEIHQELASPIAKAGLESIVTEFFRARIVFRPSGHEQKENFQRTFKQSFYVFKELLYTKDLRLIKEMVSSHDISKMEKSYSKYEKHFIEFTKTLTEESDFFRQIHPSTILKSQMYFNLILSGYNKDQWFSSRKFTHIWPFCD